MSCLFRSLSFFISNTNENQLREIIVNFLENDPVLIFPKTKASEIIPIEFPNETLENYVRKMKKTHTWGGAIEIKAFCELFKMKVFVKVLKNSDNIEFIPSYWTEDNCTINKSRQIKISWNGFHYEPIA